MATQEKENNFAKLYAINVNNNVENKDGYNYISWAFAWAEFKKVYPDAVYKVIRNPANNMPYFDDDKFGIMVFTEVTAGGLTHEMWLPVMDGKNKAMKSTPYTYTTKKEHNTVESATMFDINTAIMRCLVKNLAMFGLGLYLYMDEKFPESDYISLEDAIKNCKSVDELNQLYYANQFMISQKPQIQQLALQMKTQLTNQNGNTER